MSAKVAYETLKLKNSYSPFSSTTGTTMSLTQNPNVRDLSEQQLSLHLDGFLKVLGLTSIGKELRIGAFRFDAVAYDLNGDIVVVELKPISTKDTLAQLLLYPHALQMQLKDLPNPPNVSSLLITTHIDANVFEIAESLSVTGEISIKVCVGSKLDGITLVSLKDLPSQAGDRDIRFDPANDFQVANGKLSVKQM